MKLRLRKLKKREKKPRVDDCVTLQGETLADKMRLFTRVDVVRFPSLRIDIKKKLVDSDEC